jgi:uncharacterized protein YqiB (DUF1249 family)
MRNVYEMIYARLQEIGIMDESGEMQHDYMKFESSGLMPLSVDKLYIDPAYGFQVISIAHNGIQNGDVMADPDMEVRINKPGKMAEALTYQNDYVGVYQEVYPEPGKYYPKLKTDLNRFLNDWLKNIIEQDYKLTVKDEEE